jgi:hypothetical protein
MGIQDRDYMKRSSEPRRPNGATEEKLEDALQSFLKRHPRFFLYAGIGLVVLVILALVAARLG